MASTQSLHALLDQTGWIHALARRLVADPHLADDLAQDACIEALEQQPDATRPLRGWLATVMRNNLAQVRRGDLHRASREQRASREEPVPSTLDVVEKAETHRNIVLAVLALDEPYRSTLLMRFFEQLPYREIARRTGGTRASVNSRITRGLERLRQRLETTYGGDRRALCLALTPLAKLPTSLAPTFLGVKLMNLAIGTTAATLLAVTVSVGLIGGGRATEPAASTALGPAPIEPAAPTELRSPPLVERAPLAAGPEGAALPVQEKKEAGKESDENVWKAELFHTQALPPTVESVAVNTSSGDIEVLESPGGQLEIQAKVRARLGTVSNEKLTRVFEDHVEIHEEDGVLRIEDKHRNSNGWTVSFVVQVPGVLPVQANSASGDILVRRASAEVMANTASGDVTVELPEARVQSLQANTASGDVVVEILSVEGKLSARTASGDVTLHVVEGSSPGGASLDSASGDIHLIVPPGVVGSFDLETLGDGIVVPRALGLEIREDGGRRRAQGSIGSGGGSYKLRSASGELKVELGHSLPAKPD